METSPIPTVPCGDLRTPVESSLESPIGCSLGPRTTGISSTHQFERSFTRDEAEVLLRSGNSVCVHIQSERVWKDRQAEACASSLISWPVSFELLRKEKVCFKSNLSVVRLDEVVTFSRLSVNYWSLRTVFSVSYWTNCLLFFHCLFVWYWHLMTLFDTFFPSEAFWLYRIQKSEDIQV